MTYAGPIDIITIKEEWKYILNVKEYMELHRFEKENKIKKAEILNNNNNNKKKNKT